MSLAGVPGWLQVTAMEPDVSGTDVFASSTRYNNISMLTQLDSLRSWTETTAYKNDPHLLPIQLNEKVTNLHPPALGTALDVPTQEQANYTGVRVSDGLHDV